ncbi:MAG: putative quinol monooxygenase [Proteobacteria bacterium]|jgi:quinol monooxygenase YgiN|nr:putative quinol monooxygenase [Pseudomonadota bacterium]
MIVLNVKIETNPGTVAALKDAVATMEKASRAEPGCIEYVFATEISNPTNIRIVEHWRDVESLKKHFTLPHMAAFQEAIKKNPPKSMEMKSFDAAEIPFPPK